MFLNWKENFSYMRENSELGQKSIFAKVAISRKHLFSDRLAKNGSVSESSSHALLIGFTIKSKWSSLKKLWVLEKKILIAAWLAGEKRSFLNENLSDFKKIDMVELLLSSRVNLTWKKTLRKNFHQNLDTLQ